MGTPLVRRLVLAVVGRFARSGEGGVYRLDLTRAPLEAVTAFALRGSVVNEAVHTAGLLYSARSVVEGVLADAYGPGFAANAVAVVAHVALIAVQRYNRARMVRLADRMLALGHGYRADFRNWAGLDQQALRRHHSGTPARPRPLPWITTTIVALNAAAAAVVEWAGKGDAAVFGWIVQHLPFVAAEVEHGQWWRVLTSAFLHNDVAHLLSNMVVLLAAGLVVERAVGRARMIALYGAALLGGALAGLVFYPPTVGVVGASGGVFGVLGALFWLRRPGAMNGRVARWVWRGVPAVLVALSHGPNVGTASHVGGLVAGMATAALIGRKPRPAPSPSVLARAELDRIIEGSGLNRAERRRARRAIAQAEERYWGKRITDGRTGAHIEPEAERLAEAALQAGIEIDGAELVELAARIVRWRPALDAFTPGGNPATYRIKRAAIENLLARAPPALHDAVLSTWSRPGPR
jgi:membrane associated rhomboid family serine protease